MASQVVTRPAAGPPVDFPPQRSRPVVALALVGTLLLAFEVFVLARWALGPNFTPTPTGSDEISDEYQLSLNVLQVVVTGLIVPCAWFFVIKPWRRAGHLTTEGMVAISAALLFFWDMSMNFTSVVLFYNSHLVNFGAWATGSWPGWTSPGANLLPEPIFIVLPAYTTLVYVQVVFMLGLLRRLKERYPTVRPGMIVAIVVVGLTVTDTIVEGAVLRTGLYAYPGGIEHLTLFAGETYQIPLTETFFFGGLGLGSIALLLHFRDDRGRTIAERGIDRVRVGGWRRQWIRFAAIFAVVHGSFFLVYTIPQQYVATHSDPFPQGYKSYMTNGMCQSGESGQECPGPGVPMPRP